MYLNDHNPPHFHALLGNDAVQIKIADLSVLAGGLPPQALRSVLAWASGNRGMLATAWATYNE